jgi:hypothetical protein
MPIADHPALIAALSDQRADALRSLVIAASRGQETDPPPAAGKGPQRAGKDLKEAVEKVNDLHWYSKLGSARAKAKAQDKPILWLQALGDLDGFA